MPVAGDWKNDPSREALLEIHRSLTERMLLSALRDRDAAASAASEAERAATLRKRAEDADAAKSAFLGAMSHDLRTPLNAIGGFAELIEMGLHGPVTEQQRADLARIIANQRYLAKLITDILHFTKVGSGHVAYEMMDVRVNTVVGASLALVEPLLGKKELVMERSDSAGDIRIRADPEKATQILANVLGNAITFTPRGGRIRVGWWVDGESVRVLISDTGIGIPADKLDAVFQPFVKIKNESTPEHKGVGLGLSIARGLARAMGGDLTAESTLGEGAHFTVTLPRGM